ncbi:hypothetical protein HYT23_05185 [Candidatus Pacearchaeota archaeon]|nr:hypothetical protein [Candidatus Pacearchaeota archaeon]
MQKLIKRLMKAEPSIFHGYEEIDINYLNNILLVGLMDIELIRFNKLETLRDRIIKKLGTIEAWINYLRQFKTDINVQGDIVRLNYDKKHYKKLMDEIDKRLKRGY